MVELIPLFFIVFYLMPFSIAAARGHRSSISILVVNVLTGWTVVGWFATLAWALMVPAQTPESRARDARRYERPASRGTATPLPRILHNFID